METVYPLNIFSKIEKKPFFYSNFVATIDGKVQVRNREIRKYWPIGSKLDFDTLLWLRAQADVLIHGKKTALGFRTLETLSKKAFTQKRKALGKKNNLIYMILSNNPDEKLLSSLKNPPVGVKSVLVTNNDSKVILKQIRGDNQNIEILRLGKECVDLNALSNYFYKNYMEKILVEGGPTLLGSFLKKNMIDELFLTIAPKIFGNIDNSAKTLVEGNLFPADKIPQFQLISAKNIDSELYLRYRSAFK